MNNKKTGCSSTIYGMMQKSCSTAINLNNVTQITEEVDSKFGTHVAIYTNDRIEIPIEGELIEILALLQNHLYNN